MKRLLLLLSIISICFTSMMAQDELRGWKRIREGTRYIDLRPDMNDTTIIRLNDSVSIFHVGDMLYLQDQTGTYSLSALLVGNIEWEDSTVIYLGNNAASNNTGTYFINIGHGNGTNNTGDFQYVLGYESGDNNIGDFETVLGTSSGSNNTGTVVIIIGGINTGASNGGDYVVIIGDGAGSNNIGNYLNAIGDAAGYYNEGHYAQGFGVGAVMYNTGNSVDAMGNHAGDHNSGDSCLFLGYYSGYYNTISGRIEIDPTNTSSPLIKGNALLDSLGINGILIVRDSTDAGSAIKIGSTWFKESDIGSGDIDIQDSPAQSYLMIWYDGNTARGTDSLVWQNGYLGLPYFSAGDDTLDLYLIDGWVDTCQTTITPPAGWALKRWLRPFHIQFFDRRSGEIRWRYMAQDSAGNEILINKYIPGRNSIERDRQFIVQIESLYRYIFRLWIVVLISACFIAYLFIKIRKISGEINQLKSR